ncbi:30S ribosome-binding factor RbfA [Saccharicrinis aurantiacus]|uniref:30S ribosome-binding factor RbfA n=1 Tax=Saccharicrinis aurantiacus TaxID=1849719 RepID=UPI000837E5EA|nr:30S ribosome-binding factor RbfA [Saccharicrinis aurantiacus]
MDSTRQKKVNRLLEKEISQIFIQEARVLTLGTMVSVSKVRISPDLGMAKVYLSIFPSKNAANVIEEIKTKGGLVRKALGMKAGKQLRVIPDLQFFLDDSLDYLENIDRLLKE